MVTLVSRKYSVLCFTYDSGSKVFEATFALGCLTPNHIQVYVEDDVDGLGEQNYLEFTYDSVTETVTVTSDITIPSGETEVTVVVQRTVPKDELYISFGGGADVTRTNIDGMITYTLMALHEVLDGRWDISFDWTELNDAYRSLYTLLTGGTAGQVLTKVTDTNYDFGWANVGSFPVTDASADLSTGGWVIGPDWKSQITLLGQNVTNVSLIADAGWVTDDELIVIGNQPWQLTLTGVTLVGTTSTATDIAVTSYPGGLLLRYMGSDTWLLLGNATLM